MTYKEIISIFFLYSFLGWCIEVAFQAVRHGVFINRGFLNGPVCPIYGFGMAAVAVCLAPCGGRVIPLFLLGAVITSALEFIAGFLMLKLLHARWWDYSKQPLNLGGFICLKFSLAWGALCVVVMRYVQPFVLSRIDRVPPMLLTVLLSVFTALILIDFIATLASVRKLNQRLLLLDGLARDIRALSDGIGARVADGAIKAARTADIEREKFERERAELTQKRAELDRKRADFQRLLAERRFGHRRLLRAFPDLRPERYQDMLDELRRKAERMREKK